MIDKPRPPENTGNCVARSRTKMLIITKKGVDDNIPPKRSTQPTLI